MCKFVNVPWAMGAPGTAHCGYFNTLPELVTSEVHDSTKSRQHDVVTYADMCAVMVGVAWELPSLVPRKAMLLVFTVASLAPIAVRALVGPAKRPTLTDHLSVPDSNVTHQDPCLVQSNHRAAIALDEPGDHIMNQVIITHFQSGNATTPAWDLFQ